MITIEEIRGKKYTVVWYDPDNFNAVDLELYEASVVCLPDGVLIFPSYSGKAFAVALPALPRFPKVEAELLIYRYQSEGITPKGSFEEITHATHNNQRCEIAIIDNGN